MGTTHASVLKGDVDGDDVAVGRVNQSRVDLQEGIKPTHKKEAGPGQRNKTKNKGVISTTRTTEMIKTPQRKDNGITAVVVATTNDAQQSINSRAMFSYRPGEERKRAMRGAATSCAKTKVAAFVHDREH